MIVAKGQLQHHFWGEYCATIWLRFTSVGDALQAQTIFTAWKRQDNVLGYHGTGRELDVQEALLVKHGADKHKLGSLKYSIDYGEPFMVSLSRDETTPDTTEQLSLLS